MPDNAYQRDPEYIQCFEKHRYCPSNTYAVEKFFLQQVTGSQDDLSFQKLQARSITKQPVAVIARAATRDDIPSQFIQCLPVLNNSYTADG